MHRSDADVPPDRHVRLPSDTSSFQPRRLLVFGASGGCGRGLVRRAAERGHLVTALIRPSARLAPLHGVTIRHGEVLAPGVLEAVLPGHEAVVSCLGLRRENPLNPWSRLLSPPDLTTRVVQRLVLLIRQHSVPRLLVISAGGVSESVLRPSCRSSLRGN